MTAWMDQFHFLRPMWLWLLPLGLLLLAWMRRPGRELEAWRAVCDPKLLEYLTSGESIKGSTMRGVLMVIAWAVAILALAGPVWDKQPQPLFKAIQARVIILDLSRSMLSEDLGASRLEKARFKISDILDRSEDVQTALITYAGQPFIVTPLTEDGKTIQSMLPALSPEIMPVQGSDLSSALDFAAAMLENVAAQNGEILVVADSVKTEAINRARELRGDGVRVSVMAVGTEQGAPIPDSRGGYLKARDGSIVIPGVDQVSLERLAAAGGGRFTRLQPDNSDIDLLLADKAELDKDARTEDSDLESDHWIERGPWLLLLLLPLAAISFRRGWLMMVPLFCLPMLPQNAHASIWSDLWFTPDQQAEQAIGKEEFESAAELAEDPVLKGNALFRQQAFEEAVQAYAGADSADAHYNRGNALAQLQDYESAIAAYDEALAQQPDMEDALHNKALIEELLKQLQEQQQQQEQEQQDQEQQDQENQQQNSDQQSEQEQEQQEEQQQQQAQQEGEEQEQELQEMEETDEELDAEERQAMEQWLRRIPDDPGGLLRRKFLLEYQRRGGQPRTDDEDW